MQRFQYIISKRKIEASITPEQIEEAINDDPYRFQNLVRRARKGQRRLRENLLILYNNECCISRTGPHNVLQAAHIEAHSKSGINKVENALLLRADLHDLFDDNLLAINPDELTVIINPELMQTEYSKYNGIQIKERIDKTKPAYSKLKARWESVSWIFAS